MSISAVSSLHSAAPAAELQKAPTPAPSQTSSASVPQDTVTLSHAAQKGAAPSGDVDHDGDSH
jgi:hypothetical protein